MLNMRLNVHARWFAVVVVSLTCLASPHRAQAQTCSKRLGGVTVETLAKLNNLQGFCQLIALQVQCDDCDTLDSLSDLYTIDLDFIVTLNPTLTDITVEDLTNIGRNVVVKSNAVLKKFDAHSLLIVGQADLARFEISNNPLLTAFDLSSLTTVTGDITIDNNTELVAAVLDELVITKDLQITNNAKLVSITQFPKLVSAQIVEIGGNPALKSITGFQKLSGCDKISIHNNNGLIRVAGFPKVQSTNGLEIIANEKLTNVAGFDILSHVLGPFDLSDNSALTNLRGFSNLFSIQGDLIIKNNSLNDLEWLGQLELVKGFVVIDDNKNLSTIKLNSIVEVKTDIEIQNNPDLTTIAGFDGLVFANESIFMMSNPKLKAIVGFNSLKQVLGELKIKNNKALERIEGFNSDALTFSTNGNGETNFRVADNAALNTIKGFNGVKVLDRLEIVNNKATTVMTQPDDAEGLVGFNSLTQLIQLKIEDNSNLAAVKGFGNLSLIKTAFSFKRNDRVAVIDGFDKLKTMQSFVVDSNNALETLNGFNTLSEIRGPAAITNNSALEVVEGFQNWTNVLGLEISNNPALDNVDALASLMFINGTLVIYGNAKPFNFDGLRDLICYDALDERCSDCPEWLRRKPLCTPTDSPSNAPSTPPTVSPASSVPTRVPTQSTPTYSPTSQPTKAPSPSPSVSPSSSPTVSAPTTTPTRQPTGVPSTTPTGNPSASPSISTPTYTPSRRPTRGPTIPSPSGIPTAFPTGHPTTLTPTTQPSSQPSARPTTPPTANPTAFPTTRAPTSSPSTPPTRVPTSQPTWSPSKHPVTRGPSTSPTASPTVSPSMSPTVSPSTTSPTRMPTAVPTRSPTGFDPCYDKYMCVVDCVHRLQLYAVNDTATPTWRRDTGMTITTGLVHRSLQCGWDTESMRCRSGFVTTVEEIEDLLEAVEGACDAYVIPPHQCNDSKCVLDCVQPQWNCGWDKEYNECMPDTVTTADEVAALMESEPGACARYISPTTTNATTLVTLIPTQIVLTTSPDTSSTSSTSLPFTLIDGEVDSSAADDESSSSTTTIATLGGIIGLLVLLALFCVLFVLFRRRKSPKTKEDKIASFNNPAYVPNSERGISHNPTYMAASDRGTAHNPTYMQGDGLIDEALYAETNAAGIVLETSAADDDTGGYLDTSPDTRTNDAIYADAKPKQDDEGAYIDTSPNPEFGGFEENTASASKGEYLDTQPMQKSKEPTYIDMPDMKDAHVVYKTRSENSSDGNDNDNTNTNNGNDDDESAYATFSQMTATPIKRYATAKSTQPLSFRGTMSQVHVVDDDVYNVLRDGTVEVVQANEEPHVYEYSEMVPSFNDSVTPRERSNTKFTKSDTGLVRNLSRTSTASGFGFDDEIAL
eukprot:m.229234 g.229234  ORF g.229234 m.229234 type:complete len:1381 (-) comp33556_c0_seq1:152-4294(-)